MDLHRTEMLRARGRSTELWATLVGDAGPTIFQPARFRSSTVRIWDRSPTWAAACPSRITSTVTEPEPSGFTSSRTIAVVLQPTAASAHSTASAHSFSLRNARHPESGVGEPRSADR